MQVEQKDYMTQLLKLYVPGDMSHWGALTARVEATQPCGYKQSFNTTVQHDGKRAQIELRYPLMDDGAWEQVEGFCKAFDFKMGMYQFDVTLLSDGHPIVKESTQFDQDQLYANSWKCRIRTDFPAGFIECAALRPVCIDHDEVPVHIRLKTDRVAACRVRMDISARGADESLIEPVELDLTAQPQVIRFRHEGWKRGEYWIRVQLIEDGEVVGPAMVRKFWKEVIGPEPKPQPPLKLDSSLQYMVDDWLFEASEGLDFWPMTYEAGPKPAVSMDKPWEYGVMGVRSLTFDEQEQLYKLQYTFGLEVYRRGAHAWHFLVDEISADQSGQPLPWEFLDKSDKRQVLIGKPKEEEQFDDAILGHQKAVQIAPTDSMQIGYHKLLWTALQNGATVNEFDVPPMAHAYAILPNLQPKAQRRTDYVMLAVPTDSAEGQLPPPKEVDASTVKIFEMYNEDIDRPDYTCLATSKDGIEWEKPNLGQVEFHGSKENNIVCTREQASKEYLENVHEADTRAVMPGATGRKFTLRLHDPKTDGPVNIDKVFMGHIAGSPNEKVDFVWPEDFEDSDLGFTPELRAYYPMMHHRGNEFLFLSDKAFIYMGSGMDLMHSSESIRHQIERTDDRTVFWYYRPNTPGYPPHNWPCDNHQGPVRNLAVMWSNDGVHFEKRSCIGSDEFDPPGMHFYIMGLIGEIPAVYEGRTMLRRSSSPGVAVRGGQMVVAELRCYDGAQQSQHPELIWSRDLLHWHRFTDHRAPMLKLGSADGTYNWGMYFQATSYYPFKDKDGNDAWWLHNTAVGGRHCHRAVANRHPTLKSAQEHYPHYSEAPFFVDWQTLFERSQRANYTPVFTQIKPGRLAYTAPTGARGQFTTWPISFEGTDLVLNCQADPNGSVRVEVLGESGQAIPGYSLSDCEPMTADAVEHRPAWGRNQLKALRGQTVKFRVVLEHAKLFTLRIESAPEN